ncbi:MAG: PfkB family carbohydrate kinase [Oscillospiraceae bacterium]
MEAPKRVLCIMDISVVGRAGLSAVAPVLAGCGVQACMLPTALFSAHTGGFGQPETQDVAAFAQRALRHYKQHGIAFDAVYTGYLCSPAQFALAEAAFAQYPDAMRVVDPAMADNGTLYSGLPEDVAARMAHLCEKATLITPNATEAALLAGQPPGQADAPALLAALSGPGRSVVVTSVPAAAGGQQIAGCGPAGANVFAVPVHTVPQHFPGAGDAFTAAVVGEVLAGHSLEGACRMAAHFVGQAAAATHTAGADARCGLWLEPFLPLLAAPLPPEQF